MTFTIGKTPVKIHGVLPALWGVALLFRGPGLLLPTLIALTIHEAGHLIFAGITGTRVEEVEITPFGGVIALTNGDLLPPVRGFLLAAAGPAFSLLGCLIAVFLGRGGYIGFSAAQRFAQYNLLLAVINLLPVLPLDGGRMARCLLSRLAPYAAVTRFLLYLGILAGCVLCALSLAFALRGELNLSPAFAGLYLCYAAALEGRQGLPRYISSLISRRQKIEKNAILPVQTLAAGRHASGQALLRHMRPGYYHQIILLASDGCEKNVLLDESDFSSGLLGQPTANLAEIAKSVAASASRNT